MSLKKLKPFRAAPLAVLALALAAGPVRSESPILLIEPGGPTARVQQVLFTPDGRQLISVGFDKAIRLWDVQTGNQIAVLHGQIGTGVTGRLFAAALSPDPDNPLLAAAGYDLPQPACGKTIAWTNDIRLIDLKTRRAEAPLIGHHDTISALVFLDNGERLATASLDGMIIIWDVASRKPLRTFTQGSRDHPIPVSSLALSPDGQLLASCGYAGRVRIWNTITGKLDRDINCSAQVAAWSNQNVLATGEESGQIRIWNPGDGKEIGAPVNQGDGVTCLAFTPDGTTLLSGGGEHPDKAPPRVHFWTVPNLATPIPPLTDHHTTVLSLACSPTSPIAASADGDGVIELWDTRNGKVARELAGTGAAPVSIAWMGNRRVAWGVGTPNDRPPEDRPLQFSFDLSKGALGPDVEANDASWTRPAVTFNRLSLTLDHDKNVVEVRQDNRVIKTIVPCITGDRVESAAFTPAGDVVIGSDYALGLYHLSGSSRAPAISFIGHDSNVWAVAVSPDGTLLASASADQTVRIWSLQPGAVRGGVVQPLLSIFRDRDAQWVAWTPLGYYNASPNGDDLVGWQINRGLDHLADYYQASRFRSLYYRPDIVARVAGAGDVAKAVTAANASLAVPTLPRAPVIQVVSPPAGSIQGNRDIEVRALITDPAGRWVPRVTVFVNNQQTPEANVTRAPGGDGVWLARVRLDNGPNTLSIHAVNDAGVEQISTLPLQYKPATETSGNPAAALAAPQIRIISPAEGATVTSNLTAIKAAITDPAGGKIRRVTLLLNGQEVSGANPVSSAMDPDGSDWGQAVSLDRPDNTVEVRAEDDRGVQAQAVIHLKFARTLPPPPDEIETVEPLRVQILGVENGATVDTPDLPIRVAVVDLAGGKSALLSISANAIAQEESRPVDLPSKAIELPSKAIELPSKAVEIASGVEWKATVKLNPGENVIVVRAENAAGVLTTTKVTVNLRQAAPRKPDLYLLAIGVSKYAPPVPPLQFAAADAGAFANAWEPQKGKQFRDVKTMVLTDAQADKAGIENGLAWLAQAVQPGDWAIVFASGHGAINAQITSYYFAPFNFDPQHPDATGVEGSEFYSTLVPLPGTRILMLDTCHAGLASQTPYNQLLHPDQDRGVISFCSSTPTTDSYEVPDARHGAFTQALIDILAGKDPRVIEDHQITLSGLVYGVSKEVETLTHEQQHTTNEGGSNDMVLARTE
ncbi:MAG TPA: Ig-like domain-containing protein [Armatimonadota bacterium]|nr:Ig-like domain-containing protein [Armatimonadota bacterium]